MACAARDGCHAETGWWKHLPILAWFRRAVGEDRHCARREVLRRGEPLVAIVAGPQAICLLFHFVALCLAQEEEWSDSVVRVGDGDQAGRLPQLPEPCYGAPAIVMACLAGRLPSYADDPADNAGADFDESYPL